jgi:RimJ/RimL family protein N-acetyltransferase
MAMARTSDFSLMGAPVALPSSTGTLNLIRATQHAVAAETNDKGEFAEWLSAVVSENWPPDIVTVQEPNEDAQWHNWYLTKPSESGGELAALVGIAGVRLWSAPRRTIQVGCALLSEFRGQRLGQEVIGSLGRWAITQDGIDRTICDVPHDHIPAQKDLARAGYSRSAEAAPAAFIRFELKRAK